MTNTPNTARIPSPSGAVRVDTWHVTDDERVVRNFCGTEYTTDGVNIVIVGEQDYGGEVQRGAYVHTGRAGIELDQEAMRRVAQALLDARGECEALALFDPAIET